MSIEEKKAKAGAPKWTMTFADLSTLLLTFFVLMLSFANIDIMKFREMLGSVTNAFGVTTKERGEFQPVMKDEEEKSETVVEEKGKGEDKKNQKEQELKEKREKQKEEFKGQLMNAIKKNDMSKTTEIITGNSGIRIRIKGFQMFESGEAKIKATSSPFLDTLVKGMTVFDYNLLIEGHTDSSPIYSEKYPSNWELSAARATSVLRYLIDKGIPPKRLYAVGYADNFPLVDNNDLKLRANNRRVEFVFTNKELRIAIEDKEEEKQVAEKQ